LLIEFHLAQDENYRNDAQLHQDLSRLAKILELWLVYLFDHFVTGCSAGMDLN
jgi:hypothetical protein